MNDLDRRCQVIGETITDIIGMLEDRIGPGDDELSVISGVISFILCNHISCEENAQNALNIIGHQVMEIVQEADRTCNTMWVSGPGH